MEEEKNKEIEELNEKTKKHKVGTFSGMITLTKEVFKNRPKLKKEDKKVTKTDIIAIILTIVIVIAIGIILWFIPFTNSWIKELIFENQLFIWISSWFK